MPTAEVERQVVVFSLHGEYYGLPITVVREIIRYVAPSATAAARGAIRGMISLRGRTLPIVDLSSRLGRELEVGAKTRILVLEVADGALGLIVDTVDGILPIPTAQIEALPVATAENGLGDEVAAVGDRLIVLIEAERAFGDLLPRKPAPARQRRTSSARPRSSS
ncbi:MAG: chemotaxis protein CheW [Solirubrobacteraceae bacterium]